jgi:metal-dependent HD superfamily phosphatase/phosphodiesterase
MNKVTIKEVREHPRLITFLGAADQYMNAVGYTEHGQRHANLVSNIAHNILTHLEHKKPLPELAAIAGYLHDSGNMVSRTAHEQCGALLAIEILESLGMNSDEIALIAGAISNDEEETGDPVNAIAAAVILADKSDVHQSRVRPNLKMFDIHDRVNYASKKSFLRVNNSQRTITLELTIDTAISQVMEYFEIFLTRMIMCRRAAKFLQCNFELIINNIKLL